MAKAKPQPQQVMNPGAALDFEQLRALSMDEIRAKIVALGADWNPVEKRTDLLGRLLQLQGTAQPIDKLKKQLAQQGIDDNVAKTDSIPQQTKRLTRAEMAKAMERFIRKGMEFKINRDGTLWAMKFRTEQHRQDGKIVPATRRDTGNTMIPLGVLVRCAEALTTVSLVKKKAKADQEDPDFEPLDVEDQTSDDQVAA